MYIAEKRPYKAKSHCITTLRLLTSDLLCNLSFTMAGAAAIKALVASFVFADSAFALIRGRTPEDSVVLHNVQLQYCPLSCQYAGPDSATWTTYHDFDELALCNDTVLFTLNVQANTGPSDTRIKACTTSGGGPHMQVGAFYGLLNNNITELPTPELINEIVAPVDDNAVTTASSTSKGSTVCGATPKEATVRIETRWSSSQGGSADSLSAAVSHLEAYFRDTAPCGSGLMFSRSGQSVVGAFSGGDLGNSAAADLVKSASKAPAALGQFAIQAGCGELGEGPSSDNRFGLFADSRGNVSAVVAFLGEYIRGVGKCIDLTNLDSGDAPATTKVTVLGSSFTSNSTLNSTLNNGTLSKRWGSPLPGVLKARALCRDIQVVSGDGCGSLAQKCGVSGFDFEKFNSKTPNLCSTLQAKQWVCCSAGDLPDHTPQPDAQGRCFTYTAQPGEGCWAIGQAFGIDTQHIEDSNKLTFGFAGCPRLQKGQVICLSKGDPPMPAQDPTTVCGPWVVGTQRPANYSDVGKLNPCPLNACCDVWGQCGTTAEFCTRSEVDGHPGTAEPNTNGCVSNCGTAVVNNNDKPAKFARIGYFEGFNKNRGCLHMDITQFDLKTYTHIHFAFATITRDFKVNLTGSVKEQFDKMVKMDTKGVKKILSFGGWSFSTDYDTAPIFSSSVSPANRQLFVNNVIQFMADNNLDGLDFDWEYPGATDIPDSVPGSPSDGPNYLDFLKSVKRRMPSGKTLSIALPASYWYLKGFPVADMAKVVDYFIYMTYDLHGQWDYDSKWANPGCKTGNCLRSHVNMTETKTAMSMVTKAGVKANQIMVGVASYGRSFKMEDPSCTGGTCKFTGSRTISNAEKGECTDTSGYIAEAELRALVQYEAESGSGTVKTWFDGDSSSDIMTWNGNWVAWMDGPAKTNRIEWVQGLNFGGTTDWAVDLQHFHDPVEGDTSGGELIFGSPSGCELTFEDLDHLSRWASTGLIPPHCRSIYLLSAMEKMLDKVISQYKDTSNNYDGKFGYYAEYINDLVNPSLVNWMDNWGTDQTTKRGLGNRFFDCKYKRWDTDNYRYQGPCPVPKKIMSDGTWDDPENGYESWIIEYTLRDKEGFDKALATELGMSPDWIKWENWDGYWECPGQPGDCVQVHQWHNNFPRKADNIVVQDPKAIWEAALPEIGKLKDKFSAAIFSVGLSIYDTAANVSQNDAALALAVPVQMLAQAVQHMADVKEIGSKIEERKKKELILLIVSLVFMIVPFVGEVGLSLAGFSAMARMAFIGGEIGNGALAIAEIIDNPESAPIAIMGMVMGAAGRGMKSENAYAEAAKARRLMDDLHVGSMGKTYKAIDDKVQLTLNACGRM